LRDREEDMDLDRLDTDLDLLDEDLDRPRPDPLLPEDSFDSRSRCSPKSSIPMRPE
jgi:hypothetical protein